LSVAIVGFTDEGVDERTCSFTGRASMKSIEGVGDAGTLRVEVRAMGVSISPSSST